MRMLGLLLVVVISSGCVFPAMRDCTDGPWSLEWREPGIFDAVVDIDDPTISMSRRGISNAPLLDPLPHTPFLPEPSRKEHSILFTHLRLEAEPCTEKGTSHECGYIELWQGGSGLIMDGFFDASAPTNVVAEQARWFLENITRYSPEKIDATVASFLQSQQSIYPDGNTPESKYRIHSLEAAPRLSSLYRGIVDAAGGLATDTFRPEVAHGNWRVQYQVTILTLRGGDEFSWHMGVRLTDTAWFVGNRPAPLEDFTHNAAETLAGLGLEMPSVPAVDIECN